MNKMSAPKNFTTQTCQSSWSTHIKPTTAAAHVSTAFLSICTARAYVLPLFDVTCMQLYDARVDQRIQTRHQHMLNHVQILRRAQLLT